MTATVEKPSSTAGSPADTANSAGYTHRQIMTILVALMMGMFLAALDQTVVATAIRTIGDDLKDLSAQAWVTTAFLITSTIATPLYGKLSDLYGRKPFFLAAISIFILGSAMCSFATSMYMLAGFRAFQGIGAGGLFTLALAIIGDIIPPRERAKYQGYILAVFGTSSVLGPVVGGALAGQASILGFTGWRWIFLINVPIGLAALVVVTKVLHIPHVPRRATIDYAGAVALIVTLVPLLIVAEQGRNWGWGSANSVISYAIGVIGLVAFLMIERRAGDDALLPLRLFRNGVFATGAAQSFILGIGMFGAITTIPLYLQIVKGASPTKAGLLTIPLVLGIMMASILAGQITSRTGRYKIFPVIGSVLMVAGLVMLARLHADTGLPYADVAMLVVGMGLGLNMQSIVLAMQNAVSPRDIGVATSSTTFFRQMGGTLGVAVFLSILYSVLPSKVGSSINAAASDPTVGRALQDPATQKTLSQVPNDTTLLNALPRAISTAWKQGFSSSIDVVFVVGAAVLVLAVVLAAMLKEVPLRATAGIAAAAEESAAERLAAEQSAAQSPSTPAQSPGPADPNAPRPDEVGGQPVGPEGGRHEVVPGVDVVTVDDLRTERAPTAR